MSQVIQAQRWEGSLIFYFQLYPRSGEFVCYASEARLRSALVDIAISIRSFPALFIVTRPPRFLSNAVSWIWWQQLPGFCKIDIISLISTIQVASQISEIAASYGLTTDCRRRQQLSSCSLCSSRCRLSVVSRLSCRKMCTCISHVVRFPSS